MNSLYPDSNESVTSDFPLVVPDPKQTKAEIDYLIEVFRTQTECFKKTGRGANGATNDIAIMRPPDRAPVLLAIYFVGSTASADDRAAGIAEAAKIVAESL